MSSRFIEVKPFSTDFRTVNMTYQQSEISPRPAVTITALVLFVAIGVLTAAVGEWQFSVLIRSDWANLYGSMVFNAVYLTGAFVVTRLIFRLIPRRKLAFLLCAGLAAVGGLLVEWFLIGNSPWGNPQASQIGMAAYWACLVIVPLIVIDDDQRLRSLKRHIALYAFIYTALAVVGHWLLPTAEWQFAYHIWLVIVGYLGLLGLCLVGYLRFPLSKS